MRATFRLLVVGFGLLAVWSLSALAQDQEGKKLSGVEFSSGPVSAEKIGLKPYPGAKARSKDGSAGTTLSLTGKVEDSEGALRLHVMQFTSTDSLPKVVAFYKKEMAKYGNVLECRGGKQLSTEGRNPAQKDDLTCEGDADKPNQTVLKAGRQKDQRIVAVEATEKGTEFTVSRLEVSREKQDTP